MTRHGTINELMRYNMVADAKTSIGATKRRSREAKKQSIKRLKEEVFKLTMLALSKFYSLKEIAHRIEVSESAMKCAINEYGLGFELLEELKVKLTALLK